jgi:hypothetical protein
MSIGGTEALSTSISMMETTTTIQVVKIRDFLQIIECPGVLFAFFQYRKPYSDGLI